MPDPHPFDLATALEPAGENLFLAHTGDAYWNMVGPFGGIIAALLLRAVVDHPARQGEPVALTVNFCLAVKKGELLIEARPVRTGGSTQHWFLTLNQAGEVVTTATALTAARPQTFAHQPRQPPAAPPPDELQRYPPIGLGWTGRYDFRFSEGVLEMGEGAGQTRSTLWVADDPPRPLDFISLAALCDVFFGRIIHVRRQMLPFGTVTLTAYFHATREELAAVGTGPILGTADSRIFHRGFHDQSAELWSAHGRLLATSHQLVYYRDPR